MRGVIAVDFDGVKIPFMEGFAEWHNQTYGTDIRAEDIDNYDVSTAWGHTAEYWQPRILEFVQKHQKHNPPKPLPGAVEIIGKLSKDYDFVLITARPETERDMVEGFLNRHFQGIYRDVIMRNRDTHFFAMNKGQIAKELGSTILIDDHHDHVDSAKAAGLTGILFGDYGWNQAYHEGRIHANDWYEVHDIIGR